MINQIEPWITQKEIDTVFDCINSTFVTEGEYTKRFEESIQALHKLDKKPIAFANATLALYSSLKILGIEKGQEVIIPSLTFIATANAIIMAGGVPVCVDIDNDFCLKKEAVLENINDKTFAVMPVHLYGHFTNVLDIKEICKSKNIYLIEDASQGVGVCNKDNIYAGTIGDIGVLSFYGNKFVTSAQGGMLISKDEYILEKAMRIKNHGRSSKGTFFHEDIGFNFCISDLHSSLGYAQLLRFEEIRQRKLNILNQYKNYLYNNPEVKIDFIQSSNPSYWFISIFCKDAEIYEQFLRKNQIQTRRSFPPLYIQPCYKNFDDIQFKSSENSLNIYKTYLSLPSKCSLKESEIKMICNQINTTPI